MKDFVQILFAGAVGALAAYFNILAVPLVVLVAVMLIDYVTGVAAASYTKQLNSRDGVRYSEAIDPADIPRTYTETDEPVEDDEQTETEQKATAYDYLTGEME